MRLNDLQTSESSGDYLWCNRKWEQREPSCPSRMRECTCYQILAFEVLLSNWLNLEFVWFPLTLVQTNCFNFLLLVWFGVARTKTALNLEPLQIKNVKLDANFREDSRTFHAWNLLCLLLREQPETSRTPADITRHSKSRQRDLTNWNCYSNYTIERCFVLKSRSLSSGCLLHLETEFVICSNYSPLFFFRFRGNAS